MSARHAPPAEPPGFHVEELDAAGQPVSYIATAFGRREAERRALREAWVRGVPLDRIAITGLEH